MADILNIKRKPKIKFSELSLSIYDDKEEHANITPLFTGWLEDDFSDVEEDIKFLHLLRNQHQ